MPNTLLYVLATLIWGSTWLAITFQYGTVPATASVAYRFLLSGSALLLWCLYRRIPLRLAWSQAKWVALQGALMFGLGYMLVYESERHLSSGLVAVLNSSMVVFNLLGARLAFGRPIDGKSALGAALGIIGIVLVFWPELSAVRGSQALQGAVCTLLAAISASTGNMVAQRNRNAQVPLMPTIGYGMLVGGGAALITTAVLGQPIVFDWRPSYLLSLAYLSIFGSILAFAAYLTLLGRIGAARCGYIAVAVPVIALILSSQFEHYVWHTVTLCGIAVAVVGNIIMLADVRQLLARLTSRVVART